MTDSKAPWLTKAGALAILTAAGITLAACGGGGGLNEDEAAGIRDQLKAAEAAQAAAEAEQAAAEAEAAAAQTAQAAAEADAAAAQTAQQTAEAQAAAARTAQEAAEAAARAAEAAQQTAEAGEAAAQAAQAAAEADAAAAEAAQRTAEAEAAQAVAAKNAADAARAAAEAKAIADVTKARDAAAEDVAAALAQVALAEQAEQVALDAKAAADTALAQARADESAAEDARDDARTAQQDAEAERDRARMAEQDALDAKAMAETRQQEAEDARDAAQAKQKEAEDARDDALDAQRQAEQELQQVRQQLSLAEQQRIAAEQEAQRQIEQARQEAEQQADANARASGLITALNATNFTNANNPSVVMGVTHERGESRAFSRPNALPAKGSAPSVPGRWSSASYIGPRGSVGTDTVYLYTNIQAPGSKAFWKEYGENVPSSAANFDTTAKPSGFGTTAKKLFPDENGTPVTKDNASRGGTYDGYSGTFKCATGCNIEAADGGALTFTGDWTFTASLTAKKSSSHATQDSEFLYFGIWAFEPTDPTGTHELRWARGGDAGDISSANFGALAGEATFTGGAIGKYALARATGRGARAAKTGTFTATATFTAVFGASPTISGRITDFKEGGSDLGSDWNVFLGSDDSTAATLAATGATAPLEAHGVIDGDTAEGAWAATLHGSDNDMTLDRDKYPASRYPVADVAGVAGWFRAAAGNASALAGAFGAACTTGTMCAP